MFGSCHVTFVAFLICFSIFNSRAARGKNSSVSYYFTPINLLGTNFKNYRVGACGNGLTEMNGRLTERGSAAGEVLVWLKKTPQLGAVGDAVLQHVDVPRSLP